MLISLTSFSNNTFILVSYEGLLKSLYYYEMYSLKRIHFIILTKLLRATHENEDIDKHEKNNNHKTLYLTKNITN